LNERRSGRSNVAKCWRRFLSGSRYARAHTHTRMLNERASGRCAQKVGRGQRRGRRLVGGRKASSVVVVVVEQLTPINVHLPAKVQLCAADLCSDYEHSRLLVHVAVARLRTSDRLARTPDTAAISRTLLIPAAANLTASRFPRRGSHNHPRPPAAIAVLQRRVNVVQRGCGRCGISTTRSSDIV
jgi:hypothetical protein